MEGRGGHGKRGGGKEGRRGREEGGEGRGGGEEGRRGREEGGGGRGGEGRRGGVEGMVRGVGRKLM